MTLPLFDHRALYAARQAEITPPLTEQGNRIARYKALGGGRAGDAASGTVAAGTTACQSAR